MYEVRWIVEGKIILMRAIGDQTPESILDSVEQLHNLFEVGEAPIHVISDNRHVGEYPTNLGSLKALMKSHDNSGYVMIIGGDKLSKFLSKMLAHFSGNAEPKYSSTIAESIAWLQAIDSRLPDDITCDESPAFNLS